MMTRLRAAAVMAMTLLVGGCDEAQGEPCGSLEVGWSVVAGGEDSVDLLFVIDNSGSMIEEQASLAVALPSLLTTLLTGDTDGDGEPEIEPVSSLHLGVVTTDMGTGGHTVPTCTPSNLGDDGVLQTAGRTDIAGCPAEVPSFVRFSPEDDPAQAATDFECVALVGNGGCGFEQQLEAMLKALSPAEPGGVVPPDYVAPRFEGGTAGHGDGANAGFLRADSTLMVIMLTDEEDCSAADTALFDPSAPAYAGTDLNLRCFAHPEALRPVDRYVDGLLSLRGSAGRLVFMPIVGVPTELATDDGGRTDWDALVGPTDVRDPRMVGRVDPASPTRLVPSCSVPGRGLAFAPVRIVEAARELSERGAQVSVHSICQESFSRVVGALARQRRSPLSADCLSIPLERGADGLVGCTMELTLPLGRTCDEVPGARPLDDGPEADDGSARCEVAQLAVSDAVRASEAAPPGDGFWVDDYLGPFECAGPPSRVAMPELPPNTLVELRCAANALLDSPLGEACDPLDPAACSSDLVCDPESSVCTEVCRFDSDCSRFRGAACAIEDGAEAGVCRASSC